jgi:fatty-acyl-CoA synthase
VGNLELPLTPLALAERGFTLYPDRPAVLDDGVAMRYRTLEERVGRLAGALRAAGIQHGDRVALLARNTADAFACYTGVPLAGAILVPLNTRLAADEYAYILDHAGARLVLVEDVLLPRLDAVLVARPELEVWVLGQDGRADLERRLARAEALPVRADGVDEHDVITINYTSGTTARPKGVMQTHRNTYLNAVNMMLAFGLGPEDVHLHVAPLFHANGWGFVWATLGVGAANVMLPQVRPEEIYRRLKAYGVTLFGATATVLVMLLEHREEAPPRVRVAAAGAPPPAEVIRRVEEELGWKVTHLYGLTETTAFLTYCEENERIRTAPPQLRATLKARQGVPLPLSGVVRVVRPDGSDVAADGAELGEVVARGNVVMAGYYRDEEATRRAVPDGWFHTGDLAVRHADGTIEVKDRAKDVIISGGENIPSLEVEGVLYRHPAVAEAAVVAAPHPLWGETPVAFVVPRRHGSATAEELLAHCRAHLSHYKVPTRVVFLSELPRTASGKVQKYLLRERARMLQDRSEDQLGPKGQS